jgi:hypothetical protein
VPSHNVVGVKREAVDNLVDDDGVSLLRCLALERSCEFNGIAGMQLLILCITSTSSTMLVLSGRTSKVHTSTHRCSNEES